MWLTGDYIPKGKSVRLEYPFEGTILSNLEAPVVGNAVLSPSLKAGPNLRSSSLGIPARTPQRPASCSQKPAANNFQLIFNLANNHMMDFGKEGLRLTQEHLATRAIPSVGAGQSIDLAQRPLVVQESGKRIGIIGCCEHQFGIADASRPGCAAIGYWIFDAVRQLKSQCDFVIVSCHLAFEHAPLPSPRTREFYKRLIDAGADAVHGHHSHVPQGFEAYGPGVIFYGLGNFVVDPNAWRGRNHRWSVIANLDFSGDRIKWTTDAVEATDDKGVIRVDKRVAEAQTYSDIYLTTFNRCLHDDVSYRSLWQTICVTMYERYYGILLKTPYPPGEAACLTTRSRLRYVRDGLRIALGGMLGHPMPSPSNLADGRAILNFAQCESHQDVIVTALQALYGFTDDLRTKAARNTLREFGFD